MDNRLLEEDPLDKEIIFTNPRPNPYAERLTQEVTFRIGNDVAEYFKALAEEKNMPYERVLNMYLYECMINKRVPHFPWEDECS